MEIVTTFIVPALVGIVVGILSGLLGIGGGTILVPIFRLLFSMSPVMSTATSLFTIIPTSISGAVSHIRHKTCVLSLGLAAGFGGALTSPVGVFLATISPGWLIMVVAAGIIVYSAINMLLKALRAPKRSVLHEEKGGKEEVEQPDTFKLTHKQLLLGGCIGLFAGLASGYVGVGGGFIMVPLMLSLIGIDMKQASGTSLIAVMILAIPGVIEQGILGNIQYIAGIAVAAGSIPGALVGARLVRFIPERQLRFLFGGFLVLAALVLVLNEFHVLG